MLMSFSYIKFLHLFFDQREKWFGEDGRMIVLPNPLRPTPSRPPIPEEQEPELETQYRKAILHEYDNRYIDGSLDNAGFYQLDVDINSLTFSHHHLFSREHVLATRLSQLYEEYLDRQKKNMAEYLTEKVHKFYKKVSKMIATCERKIHVAMGVG